MSSALINKDCPVSRARCHGHKRTRRRWWIVALCILPALFLAALFALHEPGYAFLEGAEKRETFQFAVAVTSPGSTTTPPSKPKVLDRYYLRTPFGEVARKAQVELAARGWKLTQDHLPNYVRLTSPDGKSVALSNLGDTVVVTTIRDLDWADRFKSLFRSPPPHP